MLPWIKITKQKVWVLIRKSLNCYYNSFSLFSRINNTFSATIAHNFMNSVTFLPCTHPHASTIPPYECNKVCALCMWWYMNGIWAGCTKYMWTRMSYSQGQGHLQLRNMIEHFLLIHSFLFSSFIVVVYCATNAIWPDQCYNQFDSILKISQIQSMNSAIYFRTIGAVIWDVICKIKSIAKIASNELIEILKINCGH